MKVIITGSRTIKDYSLISKAIKDSGFLITEIISGCAKGIDTLAIQYAKENDIPVKLFPADWNKHGKSAGYKRNVQMADYAAALIALWDGTSKGTQHMIITASDKGLKVFARQKYVDQYPNGFKPNLEKGE